ncbi:hypothetical protein ACKKBG_A28760 [Auxenochlorella protothecoides x Auxenochlorella symbiontica]
MDPTLDAIVIGTWPNMHKPLVLAALQAGKHVLCEARMALNWGEALEMLEESRRRPPQVAQIVPSPLTLRYDAAIQETIKSGVLGQLTYITVRGVSGWPEANGAPMTFRQDAELSGDNILFLGIMYEALARWVGHASSVMAMGQTVVKWRTDPATSALRGVEVPDHLDVLARMACGAQAHLLLSAVAGGSDRPALEFWLHGSQGALHLDLTAGALTLSRPDVEGGAPQPVTLAHPGAWRVEEEFVGAIRGKERVRLTDFPTAARYMEFTTAVARSLRSGHSVGMPLV